MSHAPASAPAEQGGPQDRVIRVFLSSTFRDFNEERQLLATRVFPALNRRARERGVELVEVDLRWGVTQEQAEGGHALEICLQEIERCRPYFIGMLGDSYGSLTPPQRQLLQATPELLAERQWLDGRIGEASYTELEIEHGLHLLRDPAMAGRAFFYFRDPAYSDVRADAGEPGWRSETPEDHCRLELLRRRIRSSGFPLVEELSDPEAIANRIEADLWALIERQFPTGEQPDALEQDNRKHACYRLTRTGSGQYIGGEAYLRQLQEWIESGEQQILVTGESGAGKSALLANWLEAHAASHPGDIVHAHHLGCTNDTNALRPLLARLIQNTSRLLVAEQVISEELTIPQDWWELIARVAETLQTVGHWAQKHGRRWIWVLDGLDRLDSDDQNALPWLPLHLPAGVQVITTALKCPAREILSERHYTTLTIGPLDRAQQEQLIAGVLGRYTKQLDPALRDEILRHPLAGSPLFLRVLLEELRQCGRFETLAEQLGFYLSSQKIDDLYERVLERLENDGCGDAVRQVMSALWASRAGLTETELLAITGLAPLQWAPIDLALEKAFGRNGNRLVFDHDFLRTAVQDRYLPTEEARRQAHSDLADWYADKKEWAERDAEELPWQWKQAGRLSDLRKYLLVASNLAHIVEYRGTREALNYWQTSRSKEDGELDEMIKEDLEREIAKRHEDHEDLIWLVDRIAGIFDEAGLYREPLLKIRTLSLELEDTLEVRGEESRLTSLAWLANAYRDLGNFDAALPLYLRCLEARERLLGHEHPSTLSTVNNLGGLYQDIGDYEKAEALLKRCLEAQELRQGPDHPSTLAALGNLGRLYRENGMYKEAESCLTRCISSKAKLLGNQHPDTITSVANLARLHLMKGEVEKADMLFKECLEAQEHILGPDHPSTLDTIGNLGNTSWGRGDLKQAEVFYNRCLEAQARLTGSEHPEALSIINNLAGLHEAMGNAGKSEELYRFCLESRERLLGREHPQTNCTRDSLASLLSKLGKHEESICLRRNELEITIRRDGVLSPEALHSRCCLAESLYLAEKPEESCQVFGDALRDSIEVLGNTDSGTMAICFGLARALSALGRYQEAIELRRIELAWCQDDNDVDHDTVLVSMFELGCDLQAADHTEEALEILQTCLYHKRELLGPTHGDTLLTLARVLECLSALDRQQEALVLSEQACEALIAEHGEAHPDVLTQLNNQASLQEELDQLPKAEALYRRCLQGCEHTHGPEHPDTLSAAYNLAGVLSAQECHSEAIPLRRRELAWCRQANGDTDPGTLASINGLAIDLRETGELEEAETLFRELVKGRLEVLEPDDFQIGRALGGLAKTLEKAGKLEEALTYAQQALGHRLEHEGPDAWWTNRERLDLARVLQQLGLDPEAMALLETLESSLGGIQNSDDDDRELLRQATQLRQSIEKLHELP